MNTKTDWDLVPSLDEQVLEVLATPAPPALDVDAEFLIGTLMHSKPEVHARIRAHESERFDRASNGRRQHGVALRAALVQRREREEKELDQRSRDLDATDTHIHTSDPGPAKPRWNLPDRVTTAASLIAMAGMPVAAFLSQQAILERDGRIVGPQSYAYASLVLFAPLLIHGAQELLRSDAGKRRYARLVVGSGLVLLIPWLIGFSGSFAGALTDTDLLDTDFSMSTGHEGGSFVAKAYLVVTVLFEAFISAGAFLLFQHTCAKHHNPGTEIPNPDHEARRAEVGRLEDRQGAHDALLARLDAFIAQTGAALEQHLGAAIAAFDRIRDGLDDLGLPPAAVPSARPPKHPRPLNGMAKHPTLNGRKLS